MEKVMRLSNAKRDSIVRIEVKKKYHKRLSEAEKAFKLELDVAMAKTVPKNFDQKLVVDGWIKTTCEARIYGLTSNKSDYEYGKVDNFYPLKKYGSYIEITASKSLLSKHKIIEKIKSDMYDFKCDLRKTLYSFTTSKMAVENIPELAEHFKDEQKSKAVLPIDEINKVRKMLKRKTK
jgi:hypothetical protein